MGLSSSSSVYVLLLVLWVVLNVASEETKHNYADALSKSILFFEGQRSGKLPSSQRMKWRKDSALHDGHDVGEGRLICGLCIAPGKVVAGGCEVMNFAGRAWKRRDRLEIVDLTGGYYDAGDNVKFNFPMAFTTTVLAWSVIEFGNSMGSEKRYATDAVRWGTDYLLKSTSIRNKVFVQVGDPYSDHNCWQRPEDMDTYRTAYAVTEKNPGSEVAAETAAALASSSIVFKSSDPAYSQKLLDRAIQVFEFADKYRGFFNDSLGYWVCPFYCDFSGYQDELLWAAAWLYKASNQRKYWDYIVSNFDELNPKEGKSQDVFKDGEFGWDDKHAGVYVLIATELLKKGVSADSTFHDSADAFVCTVLPESPTKTVTYSPGGLLFKPGGSNMQHPTALSFLLLVYSRYLSRAYEVVHCGNIIAKPERLIQIAKTQVDYILGNNPMKMSYMVGYRNQFPQKIHHRGSSLPSVDRYPGHLACQDGKPYFESNNPNINQLTGAVVGGPLPNDTYPDSRRLFVYSEPTTYINAPLVGALAYFAFPTCVY